MELAERTNLLSATHLLPSLLLGFLFIIGNPSRKYLLICKNWIRENQSKGKASVLIAYSLGKAQRVLQAVKHVTDKLYAHGAIYNMHEVIVNAKILPEATLPSIKRVTNETSKEELKGSVIIAPPSAEGTTWMRRFTPYSIGICSGWMQVRGNQRRKNADEGFALSDHCDWKALLHAVEATGAQKVFVTHGFQSAFSRYLNESGLEAAEVKTEYGTDEEETIQELTNDTAEQVATDE